MIRKFMLLALLLQFEVAATFAQADVTAPSVQCINGLNVSLLPNGKVQLWTSDFLLSVSDNVTPTDQIRLGIRVAGTGTGFPVDPTGQPISHVDLNCNHLGNVEIELWAIDVAGNGDYCSSTVVLSDISSVCNNSGFVGSICLEYADCSLFNNSDPYIDIQNDGPSTNIYFTDVLPMGKCFSVENISYPVLSATTFTPKKQPDNPLQGITAYDLLRIDRHISGDEPFTQPWQYIAADTNRDNVVDSADVRLLRDLILGVFPELPNNNSWRFVRKDHVFPTPNPLSQPYPESISFDELKDSVSVTFYAIKIGDLTCGPQGSVGIEEHLLPDNQISIAPNPTSGGAVLEVLMPASQSVQVRVLDMTGKLVFETREYRQAGQQRFDIPASDLKNAGVYVCQVQMGGKISSQKLLRL